MTLDQLKTVFPHGHQEWLAAVIEQAPKWEITTPVRQAYFLGQYAVETAGFVSFEENLMYSPVRLPKVWPAHFALGQDGNLPDGKLNANDYAYNPEKLANHIYADANRDPKHALGNVNPGDGWLYRGRGLPQLTGRAAYRQGGLAINQPLEQYPELLLRPMVGVEAGCWFWYSRHCNELADKHDIDGITRAITGAHTDQERRFGYTKLLLGAFGEPIQTSTT